jgi:hypothetical protein
VFCVKEKTGLGRAQYWAGLLCAVENSKRPTIGGFHKQRLALAKVNKGMNLCV